MTIEKATAFTTLDEIDFLRGLGVWRESHRKTLGKEELSSLARANGPRQKLLSKYWATMRSRQNWGEIDKGKIEEYLFEEMR